MCELPLVAVLNLSIDVLISIYINSHQAPDMMPSQAFYISCLDTCVGLQRLCCMKDIHDAEVFLALSYLVAPQDDLPKPRLQEERTMSRVEKPVNSAARSCLKPFKAA
jgi:hypothetical protein